jgi:hypothetical protein
MTEEEILSEIKVEFKERFPDLQISEHQEQFNTFQQILLGFILPFHRDEMFIYMANREDSKCIAQHIAEIPQGISYFEEWFSKGLLSFATNILNSLQTTIDKDKIYPAFAQLLDDKDLQAFFENSEFSKEDEKNLSNMLLPLISDSELEILTQALSCIYVGLENSAVSLLKLWAQDLWFDGHDIKKILDKAKAIAAIKEHYSKAGKLGSKARWSPKEETRKYAIELMLKGNYKKPSQAADAITQDVIQFGKSINWHFTSDFQAQRTIYSWLLKYNKAQR